GHLQLPPAKKLVSEDCENLDTTRPETPDHVSNFAFSDLTDAAASGKPPLPVPPSPTRPQHLAPAGYEARPATCSRCIGASTSARRRCPFRARSGLRRSRDLPSAATRDRASVHPRRV